MNLSIFNLFRSLSFYKSRICVISFALTQTQLNLIINSKAVCRDCNFPSQRVSLFSSLKKIMLELIAEMDNTNELRMAKINTSEMMNYLLFILYSVPQVYLW